MNCTTRTSKIFKFKLHNDLDEDCMVSIFYLNNRMIEKVQREKTKSLDSIKKKIKFYESYKQF